MTLRILNVMMPDTDVPIHKHSHMSETIIICRGKVRCEGYAEDGTKISEHVQEAGGEFPGLQIPMGVYHTICFLEPGSVIFEAKDRPYDPVETEEFLVITKDVSVVRNDDIIDFMEVFYNVSRGQDHTPQKTFDGICRSASDVPVLFKVISAIGWTNIAVTILNRQDELPYYSAGVTLAAFSINCINQVADLKLPRVILEQGTECLKQLTEMRINESVDLTEEQKALEKAWWKTFLDIWKEYMKRSLEENGLFVD